MLFNRDLHANWKKLVHQDMAQVVTRACYCKAAPFLVSPMIAVHEHYRSPQGPFKDSE